MGNIERSAAPRGVRIIFTALMLVSATVLLFARLGHYALWDDEAYTALSAEAVWQTGDTSAIVGHNVVAFRQGTLLKNLHDRFQPPLPAYLAAPFVGEMGNTSLAARLPFAICGVGVIALIAMWLWRCDASSLAWLLTWLAVIGNVSLMLYCRQARYYSVAILLTTALAYLYVFWRGGRGAIFLFAILSVLLLATNLLCFAAFYASLVVDYLCFGRHRLHLTRGDLVSLATPQIILGGAILAIWNPFGLDPFGYRPENPILEKLTLLWWNWRDLNRCEFGVGYLILLAPLVCLRRPRDVRLLRALVALIGFILVITLLSPQPVGATSVADVRYLVPILPLCIAIGVAAILALSRGRWTIALPLALIAFGTNLLQAPGSLAEGFRVTPALFARELIAPPPDPYTAASSWIASHVHENESIWVMPGHMTYPLMFHEPHAIYAWQLIDPAAPQFASLPDIHFAGRVPPDYVIAFGHIGPAGKLPTQIHGVNYERLTTLDIFGYDRFRPELMSRTFEPITGFDREVDGISIFRRIDSIQNADSSH